MAGFAGHRTAGPAQNTDHVRVASALPERRIRELSLAVAIPTAMVLVDYALQGLGTPTAAVEAYAAAVPEPLVIESHPVRAVLAHWTVLRDILYSLSMGSTAWLPTANPSAAILPRSLPRVAPLPAPGTR